MVTLYGHDVCRRRKTKSKVNVTKELYAVAGNEACADCGNTKPKWARYDVSYYHHQTRAGGLTLHVWGTHGMHYLVKEWGYSTVVRTLVLRQGRFGCLEYVLLL